MKPHSLMELIVRALLEFAPSYFGASVAPSKQKPCDVAMAEINRVVAETCRALPDAPTMELLWTARAALATLAQSRSCLFLQRASACLWMLAMKMERKVVKTSPPPATAPRTWGAPKVATPAATVAAYLDALQAFVAKLAELNLDPTTLPAGETAVAEARALCAARHFIQRRYYELRRWVLPQAAVALYESDHAEFYADQGEQLIHHYQTDGCGNADAGNLRAWTSRDGDNSEYVIGDLLSALQHAADALGINWEEADNSGAWHHDSNIEEDREVST